MASIKAISIEKGKFYVGKLGFSHKLLDNDGPSIFGRTDGGDIINFERHCEKLGEQNCCETKVPNRTDNGEEQNKQDS